MSFFGLYCIGVNFDEVGEFKSSVVVDHGNGAAIFAVAPHRSLTVQARGTSDPKFGNGRTFVAECAHEWDKIIAILNSSPVMFKVNVRL